MFTFCHFLANETKGDQPKTLNRVGKNLKFFDLFLMYKRINFLCQEYGILMLVLLEVK